MAPLGEAVHAALSLPGSGRPRLPAQRPADHAPPRARLPRRPARDRTGRRVPLRPGSAGGARARGRRGAPEALPAGGPLGRPVALGPLPAARRRPDARPRTRPARPARRDPAPRRSPSCRCSPVPGPCWRCCRPTSTRSRPTATTPRPSRCASAATGASCSPSRAVARPPGSKTAVRCAPASCDAAGSSRSAPSARSGGRSRSRWRRCAIRSGPTRSAPPAGDSASGASTAAPASCARRSRRGADA